MSISSSDTNCHPNMLNNSCDSNHNFYHDDSEQANASEEFRRKKEKALKGAEERFLNGDNTDEEGWRSEALAVIEDIKQFVNQINISTELPCDENGIYLNLETKEGICLTVELSCGGFRVCGYKFDTLQCSAEQSVSDHSLTPEQSLIPFNVYYETPYALLGSISPAYRNSFSNELAQRLMKLCQYG